LQLRQPARPEADCLQDGAKVSELWRKHGMSAATLYKWKAKYGGLQVSELRRLKDLQSENAALKRLLAAAMLE
jgi:putative transposase